VTIDCLSLVSEQKVSCIIARTNYIRNYMCFMFVCVGPAHVH